MPSKTTRKDKEPKQVWWDTSVKEEFMALVEAYDPELDVATAILKLIKQAITDWYLPGYLRKPHGKRTTMTNRLGEDVIMADKGIDR